MLKMKCLYFIAALTVLGLCIDITIARGVSGGGGGGGSGGGGGGRGGGGSRSGGARFVRGIPVFPGGSRSGGKSNDQAAGAPSGGSPAEISAREDKITDAVLIPDQTGGRVLPIYRPAEVHSYHRREGIGMSAWGLIALILLLVGGATLTWFCYTVGVPIWRERQRRHSLISNSQNQRPHDGIPLQETPSTATPSP